MIFSRRHSGIAPLLAIVGGSLLVVVLGAAGAMIIGIGGGDDDSKPAHTAPGPTVATLATTGTTVPTRISNATEARTEVYMHASDPDSYGAPPIVVDRLAPHAVLRVTARGFRPNVTGFVEQCTVTRCANEFPVTFDATGTARFQYLVDNAFAASDSSSTCRAEAPPCVVHLHSEERSAYLTTVFLDPARAPRKVTVEPGERGIVDGVKVRVAVVGFTPGELVQATLCAAPATHGSERCGAPSAVSPFEIGADGTGRTMLVIRAGPVGSDHVRCGRGTTCGVVVAPAMSSVPAPVFPVVFGTGPGARYDATRWLTGLAVALVLVVFAAVLARTTDWRKPTEADTPDLDHAELAV